MQPYELVVGLASAATLAVVSWQALKGRSLGAAVSAAIADEMRKNRQETQADLKSGREEVSAALRSSREEMVSSVNHLGEFLGNKVLAMADVQKGQMELVAQRLTEGLNSSDRRMEHLTRSISEEMNRIREENVKKLDEMRAVVDEKLHESLEKRLGESFRTLSQWLEQIHKGLGEMNSLATGVHDLKKVLGNVKNRGTLGEIQLAAMLDDILVREQYDTNVAVRPGSADRVEFAIRLPGDGQKAVWLPIDSKFPLDDYARLQEAQDNCDKGAADEAWKAVERQVKLMAKAIREKYLEPPHTTDFGLLYLPLEGLYAEVLRRPGLFETLQREQHVIVVGPSNLAALLSSLQLGFRTLAIEQRTSEVWRLMAAIRTEFATFGTILDKTRKKLVEATNSIDQASVRSRAIEKKLRHVEPLEGALLPEPAGEPADEPAEITAAEAADE